MFSPVVIFCYNRSIQLQETLEHLKKNKLSIHSEFIIFQDGAKKVNDIEHQKVSRLIESFEIGKEKVIIKRAQNVGLYGSITSGLNEVFEKYDKAIIIEDDIIVSPSFLDYMNYCLNKFQNNPQIGTISGFSYKMPFDLPKYYFLKGANPWGWATWKDRWNLFEGDAHKLENEIRKHRNKEEWDYGNNLQMLRDQIDGKISSWLICWHTSLFLKNKITLFPSHSLVHNAGFDGSGTHSKNKVNFRKIITEIDQLKQKFNEKEIDELKVEIDQSITNRVRSFYYNLRNIPFTRRQKINALLNLLKHNIKMLFRK